MRLYIYIIVMMLVLFILPACGGGGGTVSETYSGADLETATDDSGTVTIQSSDETYNISLKDEDGNAVSNMDVKYTESDGKAVLVISDPDGIYGTIVMIGTPDELSNRYGRSSHSLGFTMKPRNTAPIGFDTNASNLGYIYISDSSKESMTKTSGCYTPDEIVGYFQANFDSGWEDGWSIFMFGDEVADETASALMYASNLQENTAYAMYASLKTRMEYLYDASQGGLDGEDFYLECYIPSASVGFDTICSFTSDADECVADSSDGNSDDEETNTAPVIGGTPYTTATADKEYTFYPFAYDPDSGALEFSIQNKPSWADFSISTGALTGTPNSLDSGTYGDIVISVTDGQETSSMAAFSIVVASLNSNSAPQISGTPAANTTPGVEYVFQPAAHDADGDSLTWFINSKPDWMSFNKLTGELRGTPTNAERGTHIGVEIAVSDGEYMMALEPFNIEVINRAPTVTGTGTPTLQAGSAYSFTPSGNDPDGDSLTWSISNKPSWASFNTATGALTGNTSATSVGYFQNIVITVSDGVDSASLAGFSINVTAVPIVQNFLILKTGQTTSFFSGDDGDYQIGLERDFVRDNVNHIVTDNSTGLIWQDTTPNSSRSYEKNWDDAVYYCSRSNHAGYSDWRVPTQHELTMLLDYSSNPMYIESVFNYVGTRYYWSTTGVVGDSSTAWGIDFTDFYENAVDKTDDDKHIRCVR